MVNDPFTAGNCVSVSDRISRGKLPVLHKTWIRKKINRESAHDNVVITCSKGVLMPTVRQPITKLQLTKNFGHHQGPTERLSFQQHQKNNTL